jgi:hypothetical protein
MTGALKKGRAGGTFQAQKEKSEDFFATFSAFLGRKGRLCLPLVERRQQPFEQSKSLLQ